MTENSENVSKNQHCRKMRKLRFLVTYFEQKTRCFLFLTSHRVHHILLLRRPGSGRASGSSSPRTHPRPRAPHSRTTRDPRASRAHWPPWPMRSGSPRPHPPRAPWTLREGRSPCSRRSVGRRVRGRVGSPRSPHRVRHWRGWCRRGGGRRRGLLLHWRLRWLLRPVHWRPSHGTTHRRSPHGRSTCHWRRLLTRGNTTHRLSTLWEPSHGRLHLLLRGTSHRRHYSHVGILRLHWCHGICPHRRHSWLLQRRLSSHGTSRTHLVWVHWPAHGTTGAHLIRVHWSSHWTSHLLIGIHLASRWESHGILSRNRRLLLLHVHRRLLHVGLHRRLLHHWILCWRCHRLRWGGLCLRLHGSRCRRLRLRRRLLGRGRLRPYLGLHGCWCRCWRWRWLRSSRARCRNRSRSDGLGSRCSGRSSGRWRRSRGRRNPLLGHGGGRLRRLDRRLGRLLRHLGCLVGGVCGGAHGRAGHLAQVETERHLGFFSFSFSTYYLWAAVAASLLRRRRRRRILVGDQVTLAAPAAALFPLASGIEDESLPFLLPSSPQQARNETSRDSDNHH